LRKETSAASTKRALTDLAILGPGDTQRETM
jgi:hypothetical protein